MKSYRPDLASHEEQDAAFCAAMLAAYPHFTPPPKPVCPPAPPPPDLQAVAAAKRALDTILSAKAIIASVACIHGVTVEQILSPSRNPVIAHARQHVYYEMIMTGHWSYKQIAVFCGRADHSTPWYGAKAYAEMNGLPAPAVRERKDPASGELAGS